MSRSKGRSKPDMPHKRKAPSSRAAQRNKQFSHARIGNSRVIIQLSLGYDDEKEDYRDGFFEAIISLLQSGAVVYPWTERTSTQEIRDLLKTKIAPNGVIVGTAVSAAGRAEIFAGEGRKVVIVCDEKSREYIENRLRGTAWRVSFANGEDVFAMLADAGERAVEVF